MSLKLLLFCLTNVIFCCIVSIWAIQPLPSTESCAKHYTQLCKLRHCKNFRTNNTKRSEFIEFSSHNTTNLLLEFYVIGSHDCHVHLSPIANPAQVNYDGLYDILIGGFNNSRTVVRHGRKLLRMIRTENVLSESQPVQIRIEIVPNGVIRIFHDNQLLPEIIDRGHRKSLTPFRFIKFSTDQKEEFDFYYDCSPPEIRSLASVWRASNAANHISLKWSIFMPMFFVYTFLFRNI